jgi:hypothetical protein
MSSSSIDYEGSPLLGAHQDPQKHIVSNKGDVYAKWSITAGLVLFAALVLSVLVRLPVNVFTFHPVFITLFIILATEGISLLQPTKTSEEKKQGLKKHAMIQTGSYLAAITGFTFIFYNKVIAGKHHFES